MSRINTPGAFSVPGIDRHSTNYSSSEDDDGDAATIAIGNDGNMHALPPELAVTVSAQVVDEEAEQDRIQQLVNAQAQQLQRD